LKFQIKTENVHSMCVCPQSPRRNTWSSDNFFCRLNSDDRNVLQKAVKEDITKVSKSLPKTFLDEFIEADKAERSERLRKFGKKEEE